MALVLGIGTAVVSHRMGDVLRGPPVSGLLSAELAGSLPGAAEPELIELASALTGASIRPGHRIEIVTDSGAYGRMEDDLRSARLSITLQTYFCRTGALGTRWADILAERARAGVEVFVLGDAFGCGELLDTLRGPVERAGGQVAALRPVSWHSLHRDQHRSHVRALVVDGRVAWTGGFGIADVWVGDGEEPAWRDTNVRFTGPAVAALQGVFAASWGEATGRLPAGRAVFPRNDPEPVDTASGHAGVLYSAPGLGTRPAERHLALSIASARRTLYIANSYFVPPPGVRRLLVEAAARGVDVRILVAGARTDVPSAFWAARGMYEPLMEAGVRIYEYLPTMMHAKTMVVDGAWSVVGSLNLDNRSMRLNDEAALVVHDPAVGAALDTLFLADLGRAHERTLEEHRARPLRERALERLIGLVAPLM
jgi:cardiolipin synthase